MLQNNSKHKGALESKNRVANPGTAQRRNSHDTKAITSKGVSDSALNNKWHFKFTENID